MGFYPYIRTDINTMNTKRFLCYAVAAFMILSTTQCGKSKTDEKATKEETVADARTAYDNGDYEKAVKIAQKFAEQNNAEAQNLLGYCYYNGDGVEESQAMAVKWYTLAAEQGDAEAQCNLGLCYYNGDGVKQSYTEAIKWWKKAAEQGNAFAQYNLGFCYENGYGVEKSFTEAVKWYKKAAEQGHEEAKKKLDFMEL